MSQITIASSGGGGGGGVLTIHGNTGIATPVAGVINLVTANSTPIFAASGDTVTLDFGSSFGLGTGATVSGANSLSIGDGASAPIDDSIAIGANSTANGNSAISIGSGSHTSGSTFGGIAVGGGSTASTDGDISIGNSSTANGGASIALGFNLHSTGTNSIAIGTEATSGNESTIAIGQSASATGSDSIVIGTSVTDGGVDNSIFIGNPAATSTTITGIFGSTVTGSAVLCDSTGLLGTVVSSERYKENIEPWQDIDNTVLRLSIKKFNYKTDKTKTIQVGLIAEEVEKIMPNLIVYGKDGKLESVKYHELPIFLLDIIQSQQSLIEDLNIRLKKLEV